MADTRNEKGQPVQVRESAPGATATASAREGTSRRTLVPSVDIYEEKEGPVLTADMPGVGTDDLKIEVDRDVLNIAGAVRADDLRKGEAFYCEYEPVDYFRAFALGDDLDPQRVTATLKNGVLKIVLPKAEKAKTRVIKIQGE
jgi:HSP20 family molecular chaperone IbpA